MHCGRKGYSITDELLINRKDEQYNSKTQNRNREHTLSKASGNVPRCASLLWAGIYDTLLVARIPKGTPAEVVEDISEDMLLAAETLRLCNHLCREEIEEAGEIVLNLLLDMLKDDAQSPAQ